MIADSVSRSETTSETGYARLALGFVTRTVLSASLFGQK
jgi:hypothetical protein